MSKRMTVSHQYQQAPRTERWKDPADDPFHQIPLVERRQSSVSLHPQSNEDGAFGDVDTSILDHFTHGTGASPASPPPAIDGGTQVSTQPSHNDTEGRATLTKTFFLTLKSFIGTGILFLPRAFYNGGLLFSTVLLMIFAFLCYYTMYLLVLCTYKIPGSFQDVAMYLYGSKGRGIVEVSIFLSQVGFCMAYTIFIAHNLQDLIAVMSDCSYIIGEFPLILGQLIAFIPLALVRSLDAFVPLALLANIFIIIGLAKVLIFDIQHIAANGVADIVQFNTSRFALFLGTAAYAFEGIGMVTTLCNNMKDRYKFPPVLQAVIAITAVLYCAIGGLSYMAFGSSTRSIVLLNLPAGNLFVSISQCLYILAIVLTFPVMIFPALRILEEWVFRGKQSSWHSWTAAMKMKRTALSVVTVVSMAFVSWIGSSSLEHFVSLIGAFACVPLTFIYPALFHYKAVARSPLERGNDIALVVFGFILMIFVTIVTIITWGDVDGDRDSLCRLRPDEDVAVAGAEAPSIAGPVAEAS